MKAKRVRFPPEDHLCSFFVGEVIMKCPHNINFFSMPSPLGVRKMLAFKDKQ